MMTTQKKKVDRAPRQRAPVFHVRALRELYGGIGVSLDELAAIAGLPPELVNSYESCTFFPQMILDLVRLAAALQVPLEDLIAGRRVDRIRASVAYQRSRLEAPRGELGFRCREHD